MIKFFLDTDSTSIAFTSQAKRAGDINSIQCLIGINASGVQLFKDLDTSRGKFKLDFIFVFLLHCLSEVPELLNGIQSTYEYIEFAGEELILRPSDSKLTIIFSSDINNVRTELHVDLKDFLRELIKFSDEILVLALDANPELKGKMYEQIFESRLINAKEDYFKAYGENTW